MSDEPEPKTFVAVSYRLTGDGNESAFWDFEALVGNAWDAHAKSNAQLSEGTTGGDYPSRRLTLEALCTVENPKGAREIVVTEASLVLRTIGSHRGLTAGTSPYRVDDEPAEPKDAHRGGHKREGQIW
jgi:hypothetical protein